MKLDISRRKFLYLVGKMAVPPYRPVDMPGIRRRFQPRRRLWPRQFRRQRQIQSRPCSADRPEMRE